MRSEILRSATEPFDAIVSARAGAYTASFEALRAALTDAFLRWPSTPLLRVAASGQFVHTSRSSHRSFQLHVASIHRARSMRLKQCADTVRFADPRSLHGAWRDASPFARAAMIRFL